MMDEKIKECSSDFERVYSCLFTVLYYLHKKFNNHYLWLGTRENVKYTHFQVLFAFNGRKYDLKILLLNFF